MGNSLEMILESSEDSNVDDTDKEELSNKLNNSENLQDTYNNKLIKSLEKEEVKEHLNNLFTHNYHLEIQNLKI